jgi:two-component system sensor histidine kinase SenX3
MELIVGLMAGSAAGIFLTFLYLKKQHNFTDGQSLENRESTFEVSSLIKALPNIVIWLDAENRVKFASESALSLNIVRDEKIQIDAIENIVFIVRKSNTTIYEDIKAKRPLGISRLSLTIWAMRLGRGEVFIWAQDNSQIGRVELVRRDFVANISHELKTPVGALSLIAEAIEEANEDVDIVRKFAKRIGPETKRLTNVIRDIIDLSQVQSDDPLASASVVDVDRALGDAVEATQLLADLHAIEILQIKDPTASIVGDHQQIVMAARNLLSNAPTFSTPRSPITVGHKAAVGEVEITVSKNTLTLENIIKKSAINFIENYKATPYYANANAKQIVMENNVYKGYLEIDGVLHNFIPKKNNTFQYANIIPREFRKNVEHLNSKEYILKFQWYLQREFSEYP